MKELLFEVISPNYHNYYGEEFYDNMTFTLPDGRTFFVEMVEEGIPEAGFKIKMRKQN